MSNTGPATPDEIRQALSRLGNEANKAGAYFHTWRALNIRSANPKYQEMMSNTAYVDFFHICNSGFHSLFFVSLAKLLDRRGSALGLARFRDTLKSHRDFVNEAQIVEALLISNASVAKKVQRIRNQAIAHNQESRTVEAVFKSQNITPNEIGDLIDEIRTALNQVGDRFEPTTRIPAGDRYEKAVIGLLRRLTGDSQ